MCMDTQSWMMEQVRRNAAKREAENIIIDVPFEERKDDDEHSTAS